MSIRGGVAVALTAVGLFAGGSAGQAERVYWQDVHSDTVHVMEPDGGNPRFLLQADSVFRGIAADHTGGTLYWLDDGRARAANLDGTYAEVLVEQANVGLSSIRLDLIARTMYWVDGNDDQIYRANLDGTDVTSIGGGPGIAALAIDPDAGWIYWSEGGSTAKIRRSHLDGSDRQDVYVFMNGALPTSIAVDPDAGKVYWVEGTAKVLARANEDGTGYEELLTVVGTPFDIDIDVEGGKIYWSERSTNTIGRANLDGSGAETIFTGSASIGGIAVLRARVPPFVNRRNGHLYHLTDAPDDWWGAHADGIAAGGTLAAVKDASELAWILSAIPLPAGDDDLVWLGGRDSAIPEWTWLTDEPFDFQAWENGEPDGDSTTGESFVAMRTGGADRGFWQDRYNHDLDGQGGAYGLIEFDCRVDVTGDGVVDTLDFLLFLGAWAQGSDLADWDYNGRIDTLDFLAYLNNWAAGC